ncbi:MAG TPA: hypothetical protein VHU40_02150, partial [Polyangia bacterium]|nr:hypothetical protein [Polyangia bacterium]
AVAAFSDGDFKKTKSKLLEAVAIGKEPLAGQPMLARTYLHLGVLYVDGLEDKASAIKYFQQALRINPDIQVTAAMATKTVTAAFEEAKTSAPSGSTDEEEDAAPAKPTRAAAAEDARNAKALEAEKRRAAAEMKEAERQASADRDKLQKEVARLKESDAKERAEKERLQAELKRLVAEAKKQVQDSEAETKKLQQQTAAEAKRQATEADAESKRLAAETAKERADKEKIINDGLAREKKEREAKEKAEKAVQDRDKLLAETKQALEQAKQKIQQLEKDKADRDKTIADGLLREKKEREAKERLDKEKVAFEGREKERKAKEEKERADREAAYVGPDVPGHFSENIYCDLGEIVPAGVDLYVHCLAQNKLNAKNLSFFYRVGSSVYSSIVMEKNKKGWFTAMVPGSKLTGKVMHYYAEARNERDALAATNGKPTSPNILTLRGGGHK